jgi:uncharacterized protein (DUF433 family)
MPLAIETEAPPLRIDEHGTVRVGRTRVTLDTVIASYQDGATPEQIVLQYPSLSLADTYAVIGYYLRHAGQVDLFLAQRQREAEDLRQKIESNPDMQRIRRQLTAPRNTPPTGAGPA